MDVPDGWLQVLRGLRPPSVRWRKAETVSKESSAVQQRERQSGPKRRRSTSARAAVEWRSQWPLACGLRAECGRQRAIVWPSCSKLSKCWGTFREQRWTGCDAPWRRRRKCLQSPEVKITECKGFIARAEGRVMFQRLESEVAHVVLPSPEDAVSEVMRLRDLVSQLQAQLGQGPVQDALCGPIVKRTCRTGQGRAELSAWLEERHADLRDALTVGDNCRVLELTSKLSEGVEHMVEITGGMMS